YYISSQISLNKPVEEVMNLMGHRKTYLSYRRLFCMSSTKEDKRDERSTKVEEASITPQQQQEEIREAIVDAFEGARDNTEKAIKEAKKEIPRYKEAVGNYQEKILESARGITDNYIDLQKEIFSLLQQSTWMPRSGQGNEYGTFWSNWMSTITKRVIEAYANTVGSYADSLFAATRLTNNMFSANTEAFNTSAKHSIELSKISLNNAKTLGQAAVEYTKSLNQLAAVRDSSTEKEIQKK
ncbi:MAG: hypothetical protein M3297_01965, partial [Thermoproteota archaeon]|nr:hypothetical protein [Thermoproteota archaeon]